MENHSNKKPSSRSNVPLIPPNFVTIRDLRERWIREQQLKQREKEEHEQLQKQVPGKPDSEDQTPKDQSVDGGNRHALPSNRVNGNPAVEVISTEPKEPDVAVVFVATKSRGIGEEKESKPLSNKQRSGWSSKKKHSLPSNRGNVKPAVEVTSPEPKEPDVAVVFVATESRGIGEEKESKPLSNKQKSRSSSRKKKKRQDMAEKGEVQLIEGEHEPQPTSVPNENVPAGKKSEKRESGGNFGERVIKVVEDGTAEIEQKVRVLSVTGRRQKRKEDQARVEKEVRQVMEDEDRTPPLVSETAPARRERQKFDFRPRVIDKVENATVKIEQKVGPSSLKDWKEKKKEVREENTNVHVTAGEEHHPPPSRPLENSSMRREWEKRRSPVELKPKILNAAKDGKVEIVQKFNGLPMNGGFTKGGCKYRGNDNFNHPNSEYSRRYRYSRSHFHRRGEQRSESNAGMVWMKKGDAI